MKKSNIKTTVILAFAIMSARVALSEETPKNWFHAGSQPKDYEMSVDRQIAHGGKASASLKCVAAHPSGFGTLMQTFKADTYRGQRVRLIGYVRADKVADWAGLWMRVDGPGGVVLAFDNMQDRAIKATSDWQPYDIVLDVPASAQEIAFGLLLSGKGEAWMDDLKFDVVGKDVPVTGQKLDNTAKIAPANLDFEQ